MSTLNNLNKSKIIGRSDEIDKIFKHAEFLLEGKFASCTISGEAGIGKTHLLDCITNELRKKNVRCVYVKYHHYNGNTFNILKDIIHQLVNMILMESEDIFRQAVNRLKSSANPNITLITSICPDAKMLLGEHKNITIEDYSKHEIIYNNAFMSFIHILSEELFPLVIHIDDIQWADDAFAKFINKQGKQTNSLKMFLIFSIRNDPNGMKVYDDIGDFINNRSNHLKIELSRLDYKQTCSYVKSSLEGHIKDEFYIFESIYKSTLGNPYYVRQIIDQLLKRKPLFYNPNGSVWTIDKDFIEKNELPADIVHTLVEQINLSPRKNMDMLKVLACIAGYADDYLIELLMKNPVIAIDEHILVLNNLCSLNLIIYKESVSINEKNLYSFSHDIILESIMNQMNSDEETSIRFNIAITLTQYYCESSRTDYLFQTANQIICCQSLILEALNYDSYIDILKSAAVQAKDNTLVEHASKYLSFCLELLNTKKHSKTLDYSLKVRSQLAECEFIIGNIKNSVAMFDSIYVELKDKKDIITHKKKIILLYTSITGSDQAMLLCKEILQLLEFKVLPNPLGLKIPIELLKFKLLFNKKSIKGIQSKLGEVDERFDDISEMLIRMSAISNLTNDDAFIYYILKLTNLLLKNNLSDNALPALAAGSFIFNSVLNDTTLSKELMFKTEQLLESTENDRIKCMTYFILGNFVVHWHKNVYRASEFLIKSLTYGMKATDLQYSEYAYTTMIEMMYSAGIPLANLCIYMSIIESYDARLKNDTTNIAITMLEDQIARVTENECSKMDGIDLYEFDEMQSVTFDYYALHRNYLLGKMDICNTLIESIDQKKSMYIGYYMSVDMEFFITLTRLNQYQFLIGYERKVAKFKIKKSIKHFFEWSKKATENHLSRYLILKALYLERIIGKKDIAELYDQGIDCAKKSEQYIVAAVGSLLAGSFYNRNIKISTLYREDALQSLYIWGGNYIAKEISLKYDLYFNPKSCHNSPFTRRLEDLSTSIESTNSLSLDESSYNDTFNATSLYIRQFENLDVTDFFERMLVDFSKSSNGAYCVICIEDSHKLYLTHETNDDDIIHYESPLILDNFDNVSEKIIRYVSRTKNEVYIPDKNNSSFFIYDPYLDNKDSFSIICAPIQYLNIFSGLIYIESSVDHGLSNELLDKVMYYAPALTAKNLSSSQNKNEPKREEEIPLTKRELEVFKQLVTGKTNKQVGEKLHISVSTVKTHVINIYSKLGIKNRVQAVEKAKEYGLL